MNILVTGGLGFIGSNFVKHIYDKYDYKIFNVDVVTYAADRSNIDKNIRQSSRYELHEIDINDSGYLYELIDRENVDAIVNFAAESHVDNSIKNSIPFIHTNICGTHSLLNLLHTCKNIKKFVQISTDEVYGTLDITSQPFTEESPIKPNSPYASSKASADLLCRSYYETYKYPIMITRCSNNYGPNQHPEKLIPLMLTKIKRGEKLPVYGTGENIRDWIHVLDHCNAIDKVLHNGSPGTVYNIGSENEIRNIDIVKEILKMSKRSEEQIEYVKDRLGHDLRYAIDSSKIKQELGWNPVMNFSSSLRKIVNNFLAK